MRIDELSALQLARYFDHSMLRPNNTMEDYQRHLNEALHYQFYSVAVNSHIVPFFARHLENTDILTGAAVGFPFGQMCIDGKIAEARFSLLEGAQEIDYVLNIGRLIDDDRTYVQEEMKRMLDLCRQHSAILKVILENCYLNDLQKQVACEIAVDVGIDFVKTSTGFGPGGATVEDVMLMRRVVGDRVKIKAAGAMKDLSITAAMVELGVERIGSAYGPQIVDSFVDAKSLGFPVGQGLPHTVSNTLLDH